MRVRCAVDDAALESRHTWRKRLCWRRRAGRQTQAGRGGGRGGRATGGWEGGWELAILRADGAAAGGGAGARSGVHLLSACPAAAERQLERSKALRRHAQHNSHAGYGLGLGLAPAVARRRLLRANETSPVWSAVRAGCGWLCAGVAAREREGGREQETHPPTLGCRLWVPCTQQFCPAQEPAEMRQGSNLTRHTDLADVGGRVALTAALDPLPLQPHQHRAAFDHHQHRRSLRRARPRAGRRGFAHWFGQRARSETAHPQHHLPPMRLRRAGGALPATLALALFAALIPAASQSVPGTVAWPIAHSSPLRTSPHARCSPTTPCTAKVACGEQPPLPPSYRITGCRFDADELVCTVQCPEDWAFVGGTTTRCSNRTAAKWTPPPAAMCAPTLAERQCGPANTCTCKGTKLKCVAGDTGPLSLSFLLSMLQTLSINATNIEFEDYDFGEGLTVANMAAVPMWLRKGVYGIEMDSCNITTIEPGALRGFDVLHSLYLNGGLRSLGAGALADVPTLSALRMDNNVDLQTLDDNLIAGLSKLRVFHLNIDPSKAHPTNIQLSPTFFSNFPAVMHEIELSFNPLLAPTLDSLTTFPSCTDL